MNARDILHQLSLSQGELLFLANDGRMHLADARLSVFRSPENWAVFVEMPYYSEPDAGFYAWMGVAGSCVLERAWDKAFFHRPLFEQAKDAPLWKPGVGNEPWMTWLGDRAAFSIVLGGQRLDFTPKQSDYAAAGVTFAEDRTGPGSIEPGCLLRFLCHHLNHPFFASEEELRSALRDVPSLELFTQTRHWHHPVYLVDYRAGEEDELSRDSYICNIPDFQILSRAIASGDLSEWSIRDPASSNTHWESLQSIRHEHL